MKRRAVAAAGNSGYRGFTLVELQIALLLVSLITVLLMGALSLASQTWVKVGEREDISEHRYLLMQYLRRHLTNARFIRVRTFDGEIATTFFGNREQVHFVAPFPTFHDDGELYWWSLGLEPEEESTDYYLRLTYMPFVLGKQVGTAPDGSLLVEDPLEPKTLVVGRGLESLELEYFYRDEQDAEDWVSDWEPRRDPPLAIRLKLLEAEEDENTNALPELVVAPRFADQAMYATEED